MCFSLGLRCWYCCGRNSFGHFHQIRTWRRKVFPATVLRVLLILPAGSNTPVWRRTDGTSATISNMYCTKPRHERPGQQSVAGENASASTLSWYRHHTGRNQILVSKRKAARESAGSCNSLYCPLVCFRSYFCRTRIIWWSLSLLWDGCSATIWKVTLTGPMVILTCFSATLLKAGWSPTRCETSISSRSGELRCCILDNPLYCAASRQGRHCLKKNEHLHVVVLHRV